MKSKLFRSDVQNAPGHSVTHSQDGIKLDQNESPWDIPLELKVAITEEFIKTDFNRYSLDHLIDLKKKLAKENDVLADQIAVANGASMLVQALVNLTPEKTKVLLFYPGPKIYEEQAILMGRSVVTVNLLQDFSLSAEETIAAIKKYQPGLIFISNPNSPSGNLFAKENLYKVIRQAPCLTVIDECDYPFSGDTLCEWLTEFPHMMILRTFSRAFSMAGIRVGYALADSDVIFQLEKILLPYSLPKTSIMIARMALEHKEYVERNVKDMVKERRFLLDGLQKISYVTPFSSDTNAILFRVPNAKFVLRELKKHKIFVRDVEDENLLKNCLQVTIGLPEENMLFLKAMQEIMR